MAEHDSGYKLLFSHSKMVEDLLRGFVRESWVEDLDFTTLERVNESFTSEDLQQRHGDMVYLPQLTYILIDESRLKSGELDLSDNRVATLFRLDTATPEELPDLAAELAALLPDREEDPELRRTLHHWLVRLLRRLLPGVTIPEDVDFEEMPMLEETLIEWRDNARREGLQEGLREGLRQGQQKARRAGQVEGMRQILLQLLEQRFGALPLQVRRKVKALSSAKKLEELAQRVLVAGSLAELGLLPP